jgi:hypothetical protein
MIDSRPHQNGAYSLSMRSPNRAGARHGGVTMVKYRGWDADSPDFGAFGP